MVGLVPGLGFLSQLGSLRFPRRKQTYLFSFQTIGITAEKGFEEVGVEEKIPRSPS